MIKTARKLKALVRNLTKGDSLQAQIMVMDSIEKLFEQATKKKS